MPNPIAVPIVLTGDERDQLQAWSRRPSSAQALAMRSRIVLACADVVSASNGQIAEDLGVSRHTVPKWRNRFAADRLEGLLDEPRPGRPRTIADADVERVVTTALEATPKDATHWSTRSLAAEVGLSQTAVSRIWRAFGLQPHRQDAWKLSTDPQFIDKVRDVVGLYLDPPERAVVLCVDEKSQIQALDRTAPILPLLPRRAPPAPPPAAPPAARAGPPSTTSGRAPRASARPWISPPAGSSAACIRVIARSS